MSSKSKPEDDKNEHKCKICGTVVIGSSYHYRAHLFLHKAVPARHKCKVCGKEFYRTDLYNKHARKHIPTGNKPKPCYVCDDCGRTFLNKRNLQLHLKVHDDNLRFQYNCIACDANYCEERLLKYHIRKTHFNLQATINTNHATKKIKETWFERVKESSVCVEITKLNYNTLSIKKLGRIKDEDAKDKLKTEEQNQFQEYISSIFAKNDSTQYSKAKCDYCQKEMLKKSLLSHIRERHLKLKKFKCESCSRQFARHYQMVDHICGKVRERKTRAVK